jgi:hypothetical protein
MRGAAAIGMLLGAGLLASGCAVPAGREAPPVAAIGRIVEIDAKHSFVIAEFPAGRWTINVDPRELAHYRDGDEIRLDAAGRPLPRRPG